MPEKPPMSVLLCRGVLSVSDEVTLRPFADLSLLVARPVQACMTSAITVTLRLQRQTAASIARGLTAPTPRTALSLPTGVILNGL